MEGVSSVHPFLLCPYAMRAVGKRFVTVVESQMHYDDITEN